MKECIITKLWAYSKEKELKIPLQLYCLKEHHWFQNLRNHNFQNYLYHANHGNSTQLAFHRFWIELGGGHNCHQHNPKHAGFPTQENSSVQFPSNVLQHVLLYTYINLFSKYMGKNPPLKEGEKCLLKIVRNKFEIIPPTAHKTTYNAHPEVLRSLAYKTYWFFWLLLAVSAHLNKEQTS